jgi:hypothetical protein
LAAAGALLMTAAAPEANMVSSRDKRLSGAVNERRRARLSAPFALQTAAGKKVKWLRGRLSHTYETSPVSGNNYVSTVEYVAYKGKKDRSFPRVGDVYLGQIWAGRAGDSSAGDELVTEVKLPGKTSFAIKNSVRKRKVRCYKGDANGNSKQLKGKKCPNRSRRGAYGWRFVPSKGYWDVPTGKWIQIVFPLRSSRRLKGLTGSPHRCLIGAVHNLSGYVDGDGWDAPVGGEELPHRRWARALSRRLRLAQEEALTSTSVSHTATGAPRRTNSS